MIAMRLVHVDGVSARALAKKHGVNLSTIPGTGNFGRVTEGDVLAAVGQAPKGKASEPAAGMDMGLSAREIPDLPDGPKVCSRTYGKLRR